MRTIIAGTRTCADYLKLVEAVKDSTFNITTVFCGEAKGADALGEQYAKTNNIPLEYYLPDWEKFGRAAGCLRNADMLKNADALIALWDQKSAGTKHMIGIAQKKGIPVFICSV